ncbi:MAG: carbonic anhydrase family protein [Ideonella sp.]|nr:carbonic anhydrase family protein [Ideonella sp.]
MSSPRPCLPRPLVAALLAIGLGVAVPPASASDAHGGGHAPAKAAASKPAAAATPAALPPGTDPLDHLRERLAEKLGGEAKPRATKTAPVVVKVVNKSDGDEHAAPAPRAPKAAPRPPGEHLAALSSDPAARLAALHREAAQAGLPAAPAHAEGGHAVHWAYQGEGGPQAWGQLKSEFATCANGKRQSPIDIREGLKLQLEPVQFNYGPTALAVVDNGHTVQVNGGDGNSIEVSGRRYDLVPFHFHRPSEERIDGRQFDMVAHLVHKDIDGRLAVVAVLLTRGAAQPLIQTVWNNLPLEKGEQQAVRTPVDLNALLPVERQYYTYMGSLTTPPCTEGVLWMVMKTPVQVSAEQIGIFSRLYPMNARPIQASSGRLIKESN